MTPIDPRSALFQELHSHLGWWSPGQATYSLFSHSRVPLVLPLLPSVDSDSEPTRETHRIKSLRSDSLSLTPPLHWYKTSCSLNQEFQSELLVWNQLESVPRMTPRLKSQHHSAGPQLARWGNKHQKTKHRPTKVRSDIHTKNHHKCPNSRYLVPRMELQTKTVNVVCFLQKTVIVIFPEKTNFAEAQVKDSNYEYVQRP